MPIPQDEEDDARGSYVGEGGRFRCDIEEIAKQKEAKKFGHEEAVNVYQWIEEILGISFLPLFLVLFPSFFLLFAVEEEKLETPDSFLSKLKDGVILCKLINAIVPNSVTKFELQPKHHMAERVRGDLLLITLLPLSFSALRFLLLLALFLLCFFFLPSSRLTLFRRTFTVS
jgi:hypothetical protein